MPDGRSRNGVRTLAWECRTRRRQESKTNLEIRLNGEPRAGETFEFVVSSNQRLARVTTYIGRARVWEMGSVKPPHIQRIFISLQWAGRTLLIRVFDNIGNTAKTQRTIGAATLE